MQSTWRFSALTATWVLARPHDHILLSILNNDKIKQLNDPKLTLNYVTKGQPHITSYNLPTLIYAHINFRYGQMITQKKIHPTPLRGEEALN